MAIDATPVLPGFVGFVKDAAARPGNVDLSKKEYTAENLLRDYPQVYESVARALFFYRLPNRVIRDLLHVNGQTVKAIRDHMVAASADDGRASFLINARRNSQRDIILCRLLDLLEERLDDPERTSSLTITELMGLINRLEDAKAPSNGVGKIPTPKNVKDETIDVDEFDAIMNGLISEKKSAAGEIGSEAASLPGGENVP